MTDDLDHRLRAWVHDLDEAIAARPLERSYVQLSPAPTRSRTQVLTLGAAACLFIGVIVVGAANLLDEGDEGLPVAVAGEPDQTLEPGVSEDRAIPERLEPLFGDLSLSEPIAVSVSTDTGDQIGLSMRNGELCVRLQSVGGPGPVSVCSEQSSTGTLVAASQALEDASEIAIFGAVGANGVALRAEDAGGQVVLVDTLPLPDLESIRVFVLKANVDSPLVSLGVLSDSGEVLESIETDTYFRLFGFGWGDGPIRFTGLSDPRDHLARLITARARRSAGETSRRNPGAKMQRRSAGET